MSIEGESKDQVVVTGDVDSVCLASQLRKKFRYATIISVEDVKSGAVEKPGTKETSPPTDTVPGSCYSDCWKYPPACPPVCYQVVYDPYPDPCSIM